MRQAHLTAPRTIEWRDSTTPRPGPGEILVNIRAALTCGTDLKTYRRGHPKLQYGPFGHEAAGDVRSVGPNVERFAPGDAIMWVQTAPCGTCDACARGAENLCLRLFDRIALGAYGDQLLLPSNVVARNVFRKPAHLSYIEAAFLEPLACVVHGWNVLRRADATQPLPADVAIIGAGTMGLLHLLYAVRAGVRAIVVARGTQRREMALKMGAAEVVDADDIGRVASLTGTCASVIECAGTPDSWRQAIVFARAGARVLLFSGLPSGAEVAFDASHLHYGELTVLGAFHFTPADVRESFELLEQSGVNVKPLVSGVDRLEHLADVFERLDRRDGFKYAVIPGSTEHGWI
jgi:L-iditol 2-dehydrogenase